MNLEYFEVSQALDKGEFNYSQKTGLITKFGMQYDQVIPYAIEEADTLAGKTLYLVFKNKDNDGKYIDGQVDFNYLRGFEVVTWKNRLALSFTYLKEGKFEEKPRVVIPETIFYGVHPNHLEEQPDFYLSGFSVMYPISEAKRNFPFWRTGVYGGLNTQQSTLQFQTV